jgi:hypothetical protein
VSPAEDAEALLVYDLVGEGSTVRVMVNLGGAAVDLPAGELLLASQPVVAGQLPAIAAAWVELPPPPSIAERLGSLIADVTEAIPVVPTIKPNA